MKFISSLVLGLVLSSTALAADPSKGDPSKGGGGPGGAEDNPCRTLFDACTAAGFVKGGHESGKGLHIDCLQPLMDGKTVAGVTVDAGLVASCKKRFDERQKSKGDRKGKGERQERKQ